MKTFSTKVDLRSRKAMTDFLINHFRYNTMNSWNCSTSYAANVKIYNLGLSRAELDKLYELIETDDFYDNINWLIHDFEAEHDHLWQVGFNGRSGGYLVLYEGYKKPSDYKSFCTKCGQRNYKTVEETGNCKCGRCGSDSRVNYTTQQYEYGCYPGRSVDMDEDFEDWDMYSLKRRVQLVQEFDMLCDNILAYVKELIDNAEVEEETYYIPQTRKVLVTV